MNADAPLTRVELAKIVELIAAEDSNCQGPLTSTRLTGGRSNLTFALTDGTRKYVLRMPPRAGRTPSAHDVSREYRVTRALYGTAVPVAEPVLLCDDESVLGCQFAVSRWVDGHTIQTAKELEALPKSLVGGLVLRLVETLAAIHVLDHREIGLEGFAKSHGYAERQVGRWSRQWEHVGPPKERDLGATVSRRLFAAIPQQSSVAIVHGDFRVDNTLLDLADRVSVAAVVDWELSTIGDPVADVALMCGYRHPAFDSIVGEPSAWASNLLPASDQLASMYESAGGASLDNWEFQVALAYFKIAVIAAGIDHRFRAGSGSGAGFETAGLAVRPFLEASLKALPNWR